MAPNKRRNRRQRKPRRVRRPWGERGDAEKATAIARNRGEHVLGWVAGVVVVARP